VNRAQIAKEYLDFQLYDSSDEDKELIKLKLVQADKQFRAAQQKVEELNKKPKEEVDLEEATRELVDAMNVVMVLNTELTTQKSRMFDIYEEKRITYKLENAKKAVENAKKALENAKKAAKRGGRRRKSTHRRRKH
jgi:exonuclease VII small subunit